ncbi:MAG: hydroxymethylglutaryl-CoA lyase [Actinomycetota bacterium]|nr:hydroxymethylglutaryl-CoA lyase [Actinomycetota bacterium]
MRVTVCDVGPRDGLQNEDTYLDPDVRAELVGRLARCGLRRVEAVSFVDPRRVPQMGGAEEVLAAAEVVPGTTYSGLVLNEKGFERLVAAGLREAHIAFACTETFNRRNQNASVEESIQAATRIIKRARDEGVRTTVTLAAAFGCPFEGEVDPALVLDIGSRVVAAKTDELLLADTIGVAVPGEVKRLVYEALRLGLPVGVHLHDTRHTGIANAFAALDAGATVFDAAVGGIGGCPFAPRATGNVCTEDLLYAFHREGVETGVNLDELIEVAEWLSAQLGRTLPGRVYRAGNWPDLTKEGGGS